MNPIVQNLPESRIAEEQPTAVDRAAAARLTTSNSAGKPKQDIPPFCARGALEDSFLADTDPTDEATTAAKSLAKPARDERRSSRCPVPPARQSCELKIGSHIFPALLLDKSAGGFAVLIDRLDDLKPGKKGVLHTDMGRSLVRIVYINQSAGPKDAASESGSWFRVGLKRARSFVLF